MHAVREMEDLGLIRAAIDGDERAFDQLVRHYAARLRWLIRLRLDPVLRARVSADDVLQDAMMVVSKSLKSLVVENEGAFWVWLCRVVEQRLVDVRRRHLYAASRDPHREQRAAQSGDASTAPPMTAAVADPQTSPSARLRSAEQRERLEAALTVLPPSYQEVIVLRIIEGLSVADTASIMGRSPGAVSVLLTKAVKRLGREIADLGGEPTPTGAA